LFIGKPSQINAPNSSNRNTGTTLATHCGTTLATHYWNRDRMINLNMRYSLFLTNLTKQHLINKVKSVWNHLSCHSISGNAKRHLRIILHFLE